jgi:hypothetical protein
MSKYLDEVVNVQDLKATLIACPRFTDFVGATDYNNRRIGRNTINIIEEGIDPVATILPPGIIGAKHVGAKLYIPKLSTDWVHTLPGYINSLTAFTHAPEIEVQSRVFGKKVYRFEENQREGVFTTPWISREYNVPNPLYPIRQIHEGLVRNVAYPVLSTVKTTKDSLIARTGSFLRSLWGS